MARNNTISKIAYTLNEPVPNCAKSTFYLISAISGLTDKCLVPLFALWIDRTGSDEITLREPQYVFAVNVCLMANRHSEVNDATD
mgnify:CR=1 FL=1